MEAVYRAQQVHLPPDPRRISGGGQLAGNRNASEEDQSLLETCPELLALEPELPQPLLAQFQAVCTDTGPAEGGKGCWKGLCF